MVKSPPASAGDLRDASFIPGWEDANPGNGNHSSILIMGNPMDREAWQATVHRVAKSQTWLKWQYSTQYICSKIFWNVFPNYMDSLNSSHHLHLSNITYISHLPPHPGLRWFTRGHTWKIVIKFHLNQQFILFISLSCKQKLP